MCGLSRDDVLTERTAQKWFVKFCSGVLKRYPAVDSSLRLILGISKHQSDKTSRCRYEKLQIHWKQVSKTVKRHFKEHGYVSRLNIWVHLDRGKPGRLHINLQVSSRHERGPFLKQIVTSEEKIWWDHCGVLLYELLPQGKQSIQQSHRQQQQTKLDLNKLRHKNPELVNCTMTMPGHHQLSLETFRSVDFVRLQYVRNHCSIPPAEASCHKYSVWPLKLMHNQAYPTIFCSFGCRNRSNFRPLSLFNAKTLPLLLLKQLFAGDNIAFNAS